MSTPETIVQRQLEAYNDRNLNAFVACFSEDVVVRELQDGEIIAEGRTAFRETYAPLFERCPDLHAKIVHRICKGDTVIDHENVTGMGNDEMVEAVAIYQVRDSLIHRVWFA